MDRSLKEILSKQQHVLNQKLKRCQDFRNGKDGPVPDCYRNNTPKEELVLQHVMQFKKSFLIVNEKDGRDLFLYPQNECGTYKFLPTTIRPTKLGFLQLYDYVQCASHIANYIAYEELDPPDEFPKVIPSPTNVARWQKGDCFDMSILLCSLLIGVGYNAFCMYGLAPKEITTKNESLMEFKSLKEGIIDEQEEYVEEEEGLKQVFDRIERRRKIVSEFDLTEEEKRRARERDIRQKGMEIDDDEPDVEAPDLYLNRRVHCWVLLRKGKRGVAKDLFIEPSTGRIYQPTSCPYIQLDGMFNNYNFWINMYPKRQIRTIQFSQIYGMDWEFLMIDPNIFSYKEEDENQENIEDNPILHHDKYDNKDLKEYSEILDMPPPWPPKIAIDKDNFIKGTPHGQATVFYQKVKVDRYAHYSQKDGLVKKFTIYEDFKKLRIKEYRYFYQHRSDKLQVVRRFPMEFKTVEQYQPGHSSNWKQFIEIDRRQRIVKYYPTRNVDGLIKRVELIGEKTIEFYINRDDRVVYRSVRYDPKYDKPFSAGRDVTFQNYHYNEVNDKGQLVKKKKVYISKITQKQEKNPKRPASQQIERVVFDFVKQKITVTYHLDEGEITPKKREFSRETFTGHSKPDGADKKADEPIVQMENQKIMQLQKKCLVNIKAQEESFEAQILNRRTENVMLEKTLHDKARDKFKENLNKKEDQDAEKFDENDELRPYLEEKKLNVQKPDLSYQDALEIKHSIITKFKERLFARSKIIHQRLNNKHLEMHSLQDAHLKKPDDKAIADKLSELKFKCEILDARSNRFMSIGLQKFQELDTKLTNDPRLSVLLKPPPNH